ncbi:MAG: hypothetical protein ACI9N9_002484 [Enterobacterales bacterium]|jgi:hypothetical protein
MTRKNLKPIIVVISTVLFLVGCASSLTLSNDERTKAYSEYIVTEKLESVDRITSFRFNDFSSLSDENIIISTGVRRAYLITLQSRCFNLRHANMINVNNSGSSLQAKFDSISIPQQMGMTALGSISATQQALATKCYIKNIYKLTVEQKKAVLQIGRKTEAEEA